MLTATFTIGTVVFVRLWDERAVIVGVTSFFDEFVYRVRRSDGAEGNFREEMMTRMCMSFLGPIPLEVS